MALLCALCTSILNFRNALVEPPPLPELPPQPKPITVTYSRTDKRDKKYFIHHSIKDLEVSARQTGCQICARALLLLSPGERQKLHEWADSSGHTLQFVAFYWDTQNMEIELRFTYLRDRRRKIVEESEPEWRVISCLTFMEHLEDFPLLLLYPPPADSPPTLIVPAELAWESCFNTASLWVSECNVMHGKCVRQRQLFGDWLPTRLLDLETILPCGTRIIRLCDGAELEAGERYNTLSHCWGGVAVKSLLQENIEDFKVQIKEDELSKTFLEAIAVTRRLQVRYLWIDSLCIIQDSDSDWNSEAVQMHNVYGCSYLNLAASASKNGSEGLFRERNMALARQCNVEVKLPSRKEKDIFICDDYGVSKQDFENSPLHQRAWVQQEVFLAHRTLYFGLSQLYWQCKDTLLFERSDDDLARRELKGKKVPFAFAYQPSRTNTMEELDAEWHRLAEEYTKLNLTVTTDKLPAVAGIAQHMLERYKAVTVRTRYIAGLWEHKLLDHLLWTVMGPNTLRRARPATYRAPSWSWASVDDEVKWLPSSRSHTVKILEVNVVPVVENQPMGMISCGILRLKAHACWIRIRPLDQGLNSYEAVIIDCERTKASFTIRSISFDAKVNRVNESDEWLFVPWTNRPTFLCPLQGLLLKAIESQKHDTWLERLFQRVASFSAEFCKFARPQERQAFDDALKDTEQELVII